MTVVAIIQARTSSTRLPKKVLLDLEGKTVLERVIDRVTAAKNVDKVIVATSLDKSDDAIESLCKKAGIDCYRGSLNDVLDRYYQAAKKYGAENIVRITADCPLMDPEIIDLVVREHLNSGADYTSNILKETFPDGEDVEVMKFSALEKAWKGSTLASDREHVTVYIRKSPEKFDLRNIESGKDLGGMRWTLDNSEDYEFIRGVYSDLSAEDPLFGMDKILALIGTKPEIQDINRHISRNEGMKKSLREDRVVEQ